MHNFPFQRLQADLAKLIARTPPGQRMLNEPDLAKQMGVSRATLRARYSSGRKITGPSPNDSTTAVALLEVQQMSLSAFTSA